MTPETLAALTVLLLICVAATFAWTRSDTSHSLDERGLPPELQGARVAHAEQTFRSRARRLVARVDRAYDFGEYLVLVELKTRRTDTVYMADILELSVQRVALQDERGVRVSMTAWVVTQNSVTGVRKAHRVTLVGTEEVVALRTRYLEVEASRGVPARGARSLKQCASCGHRSICGARRYSQPSPSRS